MRGNLRPAGQLDRNPPGSPSRVWFGWLQQTASLIYLAAGGFLLYQYFTHLHRQVVLLTGILFIAYSIYRFFLVRRSVPRR